MQKQKPNFHHITEAITILEITRGMLDSSKEQLETMKKAKDRPNILDDKIINRSIKLYTKQNEDSDVFYNNVRYGEKINLQRAIIPGNRDRKINTRTYES